MACTQRGSVGVRVRYIVHNVLINVVDIVSAKISLTLGTFAIKNVRCCIITTVQLSGLCETNLSNFGFGCLTVVCMERIHKQAIVCKVVPVLVTSVFLFHTGNSHKSSLVVIK